jgi:Na+/serine symporter
MPPINSSPIRSPPLLVEPPAIALGVGHVRAASLIVSPAWCALFGLERPDVALRVPMASFACAVGQDEHPLPLVRSANVRRSEEDRAFERVTQSA